MPIPRPLSPAPADLPAFSLVRGFNFEGCRLRCEVVDEQPIWHAGDLAEALGCREAHSITRLLGDDVADLKVTHEVWTPGGKQRSDWLTMAGVWEVLALSRKPAAKRLRRFMTTVVMPSIMTRGGYVHREALEAGITIEDLAGPPPAVKTEPAPAVILASIPGLGGIAEIRALLAQSLGAIDVLTTEVASRDQTIAERDKRIAQLEPVERIIQDGRSLTVKEAAAALCGCGFDYGERQLYRWFEARGWVTRVGDGHGGKRWAPTRDATRTKRLSVQYPKSKTWAHPHTGERLPSHPTCVVTPKGLGDTLRIMLEERAAANQQRLAPGEQR
jgi:hypothetical protein